MAKEKDSRLGKGVYIVRRFPELQELSREALFGDTEHAVAPQGRTRSDFIDEGDPAFWQGALNEYLGAR